VIDTSKHSPADAAVAIRNFLRDHPRETSSVPLTKG
jgi:hypothetical protein